MLRQQPGNVFMMPCDRATLQDEDLGSGGRYLGDVHHRVTAQRSCRGQVIKAQQRGDDSVLIDSPNHGAIHKEDSAIFVDSDS